MKRYVQYKYPLKSSIQKNIQKKKEEKRKIIINRQMEQYSKKLQDDLRQFLLTLRREMDIETEIKIIAEAIVIERPGQITVTAINDILRETILEKCKHDLNRPGVNNVQLPTYLVNITERLPVLLEQTRRPEFKQRTTPFRLEVLYYLGKTLIEQGWLQRDMDTIHVMFTTTKGANDFTRSARQVYELFDARELPLLYAVRFIWPYHLLQLSHEEFYDHLIPEARRLAAENGL
jgi:hypothetical protein